MALPDRILIVPSGYDLAVNPRVSSFAAQLDDQLTALRKSTEGLEPAHLEWQSHPGLNTIGMLIAHLAIVDVWWIRLAPRETPETETETVMKGIIGIGMDDDGMPMKADGLHPATLKGKSLVDYLRLIDSARVTTHDELRKWSDADLGTTYRLKERVISREWTVYHVLDHFSSHCGQILLLKHLMRDAGILQT